MITKAELALVRSLGDKRERVENGLFVVEGRKIVQEFVSWGSHVQRVYHRDGCESFVGVDCVQVGAKDLERMSQFKTPPDYIATVKIPQYDISLIDPTKELVLVLDNVQDPGNLGTIIRMADWFGIRDIVCSRETADCFNPKVVQATMGALMRVRVHYCDLVKFLKGSTAPVYGTFLEGENIYTAPLESCGFVVMGNEGNGITAGLAREVSNKIFIPSYPAGVPTAESLNVATATAIVCSEFRRPR